MEDDAQGVAIARIHLADTMAEFELAIAAHSTAWDFGHGEHHHLAILIWRVITPDICRRRGHS